MLLIMKYVDLNHVTVHGMRTSLFLPKALWMQRLFFFFLSFWIFIIKSDWRSKRDFFFPELGFVFFVLNFYPQYSYNKSRVKLRTNCWFKCNVLNFQGCLCWLWWQSCLLVLLHAMWNTPLKGISFKRHTQKKKESGQCVHVWIHLHLIGSKTAKRSHTDKGKPKRSYKELYLISVLTGNKSAYFSKLTNHAQKCAWLIAFSRRKMRDVRGLRHSVSF